MRACWVLVSTVLLQAGCERSAGRTAETGTLEASWTGSDTGRMGAPARAEWCDSLGVLEIRAILGDTGLALALYAMGRVEPDSYPVARPTPRAPKPPAAGIAARWFAETAIRGFQGDSGAVVVETGGAQLSGRFRASMRSVNDSGRLELSGRFSGVRITPAGRGCVARRPVERPDSGVH